MGEEFSMGSALDLAGRQRELVEGQNQAVDQAHGNVQQASGANANTKKAAWIKAQNSKFEAMRAQADVKQAGAERNFAVLKSVINLGFKVFGQKMAQWSDKKSDSDRARDAVENGAAAMRRLSDGGSHDQKVGELLDFQKMSDNLKTQQNGVRAELNDLMAKHDGGKIWTAEDQALAKNLRQEDMNLERQAELLAGIAQAKAAGGFSNTMLSPQSERFDDTRDQAQANTGDFLKQQGFDARQIESMKQLSRMQEEANGLRSERADLKAKINGDNGDYTKGLQEKTDPLMGGLQKELNSMLQDQEDVRRFGAAAKFVEAEDAYNKLKNQPGADPSAVAKAHADMDVAESGFSATRNRPLNQKPGYEMLSTVMGDALGIFDQLRQLNRQYAQAQAQLSAATEQAGSAMEQAKDMELS
jgi:hypothetical protein